MTPIAQENVFTPADSETGTRLRLSISSSDMQMLLDAGKRHGIKGTITDLVTNTRYQILGATCGIPRCYCDATAIRLETIQ